MVINVTASADRLRSISVDGYAAGHNRPGNCARWNYFAMPGVQPNLTPIPSAYSLWTSAPPEHRHPIPTDRPVPRGLPIILGPSSTRHDANASAGDVFPADGIGIGRNGLGPMTDSPRLGAGRIGQASIGERETQSQRTVLGYLTWFGGYPITSDGLTTTPAATTTEGTPIMEIVTDNKTGQLLNLDGTLFAFGEPSEVTIALQNGCPVRVVAPGVFARMSRIAVK